MDKKQKRWFYLSLAFSMGILVFLLASTFNEDTLQYLTHINIWFLFMAIGLRFISFSLWAARIKVMAASLGYQVRYSHCYNMVVANLLIGAITPGQAGGEPVRIHELYKADMPVGDATAVVIMERVLDAVILVALTVFSLLVMGKVIWDMGEGIVFIIFFSLALLILFVAILFFAAKRPESAKEKVMRLLHWIEAKMKTPGIRRIIASTDVEFDNFCSGITAFTSHGKKGIIQGSLFSILFWFSEFIVASVILMGLGLPPAISESILSQIIIALISMIPLTPGASGIAEISATSLYALFVPTAVLGVFIILWRLIMFYLNIVFGVIATVLIFKREISA
ncbi:MAG TPA: flippase-like domain-containing protein [Methanospirillum sp.]|uniref:lysylphosphatidylglycerol synthase transmembrane domain-containing protein n=1 Tax=Methanospirillum sp. TaxID=45200 RepID=UPI002C0C7F08|nr:flippase-like domain-containing protein [Methanospirillum sp.]HOJ97172.1 flippase-like domain-containing protein [Methanospirillum sp.]HOL40762.1 flippase-like domain-containing protein [Methanospirillum sp.]HPP77396.1 flippase-like domain-containing protein [Methanospirillum sp.]